MSTKEYEYLETKRKSRRERKWKKWAAIEMKKTRKPLWKLWDSNISRREWLSLAKIAESSININQKAVYWNRSLDVIVVLIRAVSVKLWGENHSVMNWGMYGRGRDLITHMYSRAHWLKISEILENFLWINNT